MRQRDMLLILAGLAGATAAAAAPTTRPVAIGLDHDGEVCFVASVNPMVVADVEPGDRISWTATSANPACDGAAVSLANFKLKANGQAKDPVPGCKKDIVAGGDGIICTVNNASHGETFKYDVELAGGRGMDPEIQIRR